jgi:hypothetical protein
MVASGAEGHPTTLTRERSDRLQCLEVHASARNEDARNRLATVAVLEFGASDFSTWLVFYSIRLAYRIKTFK